MTRIVIRLICAGTVPFLRPCPKVRPVDHFVPKFLKFHPLKRPFLVSIVNPRKTVVFNSSLDFLPKNMAALRMTDQDLFI